MATQRGQVQRGACGPAQGSLAVPRALPPPSLLCQIGLDTGFWTAINHFFIWGSLAAYFAILFAMHSDGLFQMFPNQFRFVGESRGEPSTALPPFWGPRAGRCPHQALAHASPLQVTRRTRWLSPRSG